MAALQNRLPVISQHPEPIVYATLKRQWQVIDQKQPNKAQPHDRFGISIGRWRPMPFVRNDDKGHDLRVLLRFDGNGKAMPEDCDWVLEIPLTEHQFIAQEVRNNRAAKLTGPTLKPGEPIVAALPVWQRSWHSGKASWNEMRPGMPWLAGISQGRQKNCRPGLRLSHVAAWCNNGAAALISSAAP